MALPAWLREAEQEAINATVMAGFVVAKRKGTTAPGEQYVIGTLRDFLLVVNTCPHHVAGPAQGILRSA